MKINKIQKIVAPNRNPSPTPDSITGLPMVFRIIIGKLAKILKANARSLAAKKIEFRKVRTNYYR